MALTNNQITAQNFKDFYGQIRPYLNGNFPTPIVNCFAKSDMHSTDEKIIGQWEDGKPLYQRTYNFTLPVIYDGTENGCDVVTLENTKIISIDGYISGNNQTSYPLTFTTVSSGETRFVNCFKNGSGIVKIKTNLGTISEKSGYVTLRYVKTTDSAIKVGTGTDYSTDEQIIGSWIDGKPLYQKTYVTTSPSNSTDTKIIDLPVSFEVKNVDGILLQTPNNVMPINTYYGSSSYVSTYAQYSPESGVRMMAASGQYQNKTCYITILYTKTTDV